MSKNEESKLADEILNWYWINKSKIIKNKRFWAQNSIGYAISTITKENGRWKNAPRGKRHKQFPTLRVLNENEIDF